MECIFFRTMLILLRVFISLGYPEKNYCSLKHFSLLLPFVPFAVETLYQKRINHLGNIYCTETIEYMVTLPVEIRNEWVWFNFVLLYRIINKKLIHWINSLCISNHSYFFRLLYFRLHRYFFLICVGIQFCY